MPMYTRRCAKSFPFLASLLCALSGCGGGSSGSPPPPDDPERPLNTSCLAVDKPVAAADYALNDISPGIGTLRAASKIAQAPNQPDRWYVLEQAGWIKKYDTDSGAAADVWLDFPSVRDPAATGDGRLLGVAFDPAFPAAPRVYVYYTGAFNGGFASVLLRVTLDDVDNPASPLIETILVLPQTSSFHKGGDVQFGPDGYLYIAFGDGGGTENRRRAQDTGNWFGSMLRIDVSGNGDGYTVPPDNPFAGNPSCATGVTGQNCPEIFAYGLRNPFRWSFDASGRLWVGDVGEVAREEINLVVAGANYGWPCREGTLGFQPQLCAASDTLVPPVYEYARDAGDGASVTGGSVYAGSLLPELQGQYLFADFVTGEVWTLIENGDGTFGSELLVDADFFIPSLEIGLDGELYVTDRSNSRITRLEALSGGGQDTVPTKLSDTGCFDSNDPQAVATGVIPYELNTPFWSDGAVKNRFFAIPDGTTIDIDDNDDLLFPTRSVLIKHFRLDDKLIETRLLMRHPDGSWGGYTWEWNDAETEATRVIGGKLRNVDGQQWIYPSEGQCTLCHTSVAGFSLGPETAQFNRSINYPAPLGGAGNQLDTLDDLGYFTSPLPDAGTLPKLAAAADTSADLDARARAWLHANCSNCHQPGGPTSSSMDLRYNTPLPATNACNVMPSDDLDIANARIIAPGEEARSVLLERISRRDDAGMPPLASNEVDSDGVALIDAWIGALPNCN